VAPYPDASSLHRGSLLVRALRQARRVNDPEATGRLDLPSRSPAVVLKARNTTTMNLPETRFKVDRGYGDWVELCENLVRGGSARDPLQGE
jgi:hypothetical protein